MGQCVQHQHECFAKQAGLADAAAAVFLTAARFGENLETATLQNQVSDPAQPPEEYAAQFLSKV